MTDTIMLPRGVIPIIVKRDRPKKVALHIAHPEEIEEAQLTVSQAISLIGLQLMQQMIYDWTRNPSLNQVIRRELPDAGSTKIEVLLIFTRGKEFLNHWRKVGRSFEQQLIPNGKIMLEKIPVQSADQARIGLPLALNIRSV